MSAYAERALIVPFPPVPLFTGAGPFGCLVNSGGQNQDLFPSYSRALGPFAIKICEGLLLSYTAWCLPTCLVRSPSIAQLPWLCQTRRCPYSADTSKFLTRQGPVPRGKKHHRSCLCPPGGHNQSLRQVSPVAGGPGVRDYEHPPLARCSSDRNPRGIFGSFLGKQKGTRPAGRNPLKTQKKETHNAERR